MRVVVTACECFFFPFSIFGQNQVGGDVGASIQMSFHLGPGLVMCPELVTCPPPQHPALERRWDGKMVHTEAS